jgi:predicted RNA-binding protein with TRAM domain
MFGQGGFSTPPVQVGEELDVVIEAVGEKGDGIAKKDGFVLFIPGVKEGDSVRVKVTKVLRKVGFAEVVGEASAAPASNNASADEAPEAPVEEVSSEDSESFGEEEDSAEEMPVDEGIESTDTAEEDSTEDLTKETE